MATSQEVQLKRYPEGLPTADDFKLERRELPDAPPEGGALVRNLFLSVDPYMRGRMSGRRTYIDPFPLNDALEGGAVGVVEKSRHPDIKEGSYVLSFKGWREAFITQDPSELTPVQEQPGLSLSAYLGVLGMPGLTAYAGLFDVAQLNEGERVFISGAAGAVGSIAGQIAKAKGCFVVGSCGSPEKARYLTEELGFDHALNYKERPIAEQLAEVAGEGFDVYFDNVGGDHLEAALNHMRDFGRLALCGAISQYNSQEPAPGPRNLMNAVVKRLKLQGFIVSDHLKLQNQFVQDMSRWLQAGDVRYRETVVDGIDHTVDAFLGLFKGENLGKMVVKLNS
jgi:hypothetical protein